MKPLCKLCQSREADQTGSHITSAFLLTSQIGKRGEEKSFLITTNPGQDYLKNIRDEGLVENYLFCRDCEKRFGIAETLYATEITQKIEEKKFDANFERTNLENGNYTLQPKRLSPIAFQLLFMSNIWKASISQESIYTYFNLGQELNERLRSNLDLFLPTVINFKLAQSPKEWSKMIEECGELFDSIPMSIIKAENLEHKDMNYEWYDNITNSPFHIMLNDYVILIFTNPKEWKDDFFEMKAEFQLKDVLTYGIDKSVIGIISSERFLAIQKMIENAAKAQRDRAIILQCIKELKHLGIPITPVSINKMVNDKNSQIKKERED